MVDKMETINAVGKPCPIPVIEAKKAIRSISSEGGSVAIQVDNDIARQNLEKMAVGLGHTIHSEELADGTIVVTIAVKSTACASANESDTELIVAIGTDAMGKGSEELGRILMKSFIFSLTELDTPPEHLLFFNSGANLTIEDSNVLEDLRTLSEKGTLISTCGTCLNYYHNTEKLAIGDITNMYGIVNVMAEGKKVITL
jgi:selenium metabolism protein YedF